MFKELKDSISEYNPGEDELDSILHRVKKSSLVHSGENRIGEIYETWVYEYLKSWAVQCQDVKSFLLKEEFQKTYNGLSYDKNCQIVFYKNGRKVAEYDSLFIYKDKVVFVESSISDLRSYYRKLEDRLIIKRQYLVDLFKTEEVYYLLVTRPKKRTIPYRSLPHLILYKLKNPDISEIDENIQALDLNSKKLTKLQDFISSFSSF